MFTILTLTIITTLLLHSTHALINATTTNSSSYAFTAAIFQPALTDYSTPFICSGSLINPSTVLTLAECVNGLGASDLLVRLGDSELNYVNATVDDVIVRADFNASSLNGEVAVLKLSRAVTGIAPVEMLYTQVSASRYVKGPSTTSTCWLLWSRLTHLTTRSVRLLGWGPKSTPPTQALSPSLGSLTVYTLPQPICEETLSPCFNLTTAHFCTQVPRYGGESYGDAGGPVLAPDGRLMGLVSGNPECAVDKGIALMVDLVEFGRWIEEVAC
jgi:secreted trypsin-like serine protease